MTKKISLDLAHKFLGVDPPTPASSKSTISARKKQMDGLREKHPILIAITFKIPWWVIGSDLN